MDEFDTDEAAELPPSSATSPRWTGAPSIALAHGLNEQCVELVRWDSHPEFWGDLLVACRGRDERVLAALRRQGKLLFCGELIEGHK